MEFAVVLPLFVIILFAIVDFGIFFFVQHTVQFATREGARVALVGRQLDDGAGNPLSREASIVKTIEDKAKVAVRPTDLTIAIYAVNADYTDPTGWLASRDAGLPGQFMRVRVRYHYKLITPLIGSLFNGGKILVQAEATYKNEQFN